MDISRFLYAPLLFIGEYIFKFLAGVGAAMVLAAEGSFFNKISTGLGSMIPAVKQLTRAPENIRYISNVIEDYNTMTAASFNQRYGGEAINQVMKQLNESVAYGEHIYHNLVQQPIITLLATLIVFFIFYLIGRGARFVRQQGQGSYFNKLERKLGNRVFEKSNNIENTTEPF